MKIRSLTGKVNAVFAKFGHVDAREGEWLR